MSQQSSTTTNTPSEPVLCESGCGFFGSSATGNFCSKCWNEAQKKKDGGQSSSHETAATPMELCTPVPPQPTQSEVAPSPAAPMEKMVTPLAEPAVRVVKKKKKPSYKSMMANMTKRTKDENDILREKESLRKVTGGGAFSKIDKI